VSDQQSQRQQQLPPIIDAQELSEESQRQKALFDEIEAKQLETLDEASKGLIERIATFLGVLFGVTVLSSNFPPVYLKGNATSVVAAKVMVTIALVCFLGSIAAATWGTQVHTYRRYTYNVSKNSQELKRMISRKLFWSRVANILFAMGAIALAGLLIVIIWSL
jgi:hypothetical protein